MPHVILASAGELDPTFGGDGKVTTPFPLGADFANAIVLQPDGKIIAVGSSAGSFALVRYNNNGTLDSTFGDNGIVTTESGWWAYAVALQPDGKIIAVGTHSWSTFALARYNPDGSLDSTFDGDGKVTTDFAPGWGFASATVLQPDGKIIAVGTAYTGTTEDFALVRYNADGSLDTTFDGDGKLTTDFATTNDHAQSVSLQPDGRILVAGYTDAGNNAIDFALARYNSNGTLDVSFDGDGKVTTDFGNSEEAFGVALQLDGKIIAVGRALGDFALVRYNSNGSLDSSFDGDGKVTTDFFQSTDGGHAVILQPDGKIIAAGTTGDVYDFGLVRYQTDGSLDFSFDGDGKVITDFGSDADQALAVALQSDGRIVAAGYTHNSNTNNNDFALARYLGDFCLFCDDFEDGILSVEWDYVKPLWNETAGNLIGVPSQRKAEAIATRAFSGCSVCSVSASMRSSGGFGNKVWLLSWFEDKRNTIEVLMKEENDKWVLKQRVNGNVVAKGKGVSLILPDVFYNAVVTFDGANFTLTVDGALLVTMPAFVAPNGTVGFRAKNTTASFGFVTIN